MRSADTKTGSPSFLECLKSPSSIHDIAEVGDLVPLKADLSRDNRAAMENGAKFGNLTKARLPRSRLNLEGLRKIENTTNTRIVAHSSLHRPCDHCHIPDVVVDRAFEVSNRSGQRTENLSEVSLSLQISVSFRELRRPAHVEKQKDSSSLVGR